MDLPVHLLRHFAQPGLLLFLILIWSCDRPGTPHHRPPVEGTHASLGLAGYAKVLCSAVYVSNRHPDTAAHQSGYFLLPEHLQDAVRYEIDREDRAVVMHLGDSLTARARYFGDQGCVILPGDRAEPFFEPVEVRSSLPPASTMEWPLGDLDAYAAEPDRELLDLKDEIKRIVFAPGAMTAALILIQNGKILMEEYGAGASRNMQLESWSMGKSLTSTLVGRMIHMGYFELDQPAPVETWRSEGDPRSEITIRHLLQMSSGLHFTSHRDPEAGSNSDYLDHFYIYTGAIDAFKFSIDRPLQFAPGTEGRYRNCDPMALGYIMRQALGEEYWSFPQRELFDKIGIREQVLETDPYGNFLLSGYDYGTARNWARLGLLYLNNGTVMGERLLPENWAAFVSTPAPGWSEPVYGGMFWLNRNGEFDLPPDAYYMAGAGGQYTVIVPSLDLVIVRMGHFRGAQTGTESLNRACPLIVDLVAN